MAEIPVRTPGVGGINLALAAAAANDTAKVGPGYTLLVNNGSGGEVDVTIAVDGNTAWGVAQPDKVIAVPAGETWAIPLHEFYADSDDGLAHITWESTTSVTRVVLKR